MQKPEERKGKSKMIQDTHAVLERSPFADSLTCDTFRKVPCIAAGKISTMGAGGRSATF